MTNLKEKLDPVWHYLKGVWSHSVKQEHLLSSLQHLAQIMLLILSVWVYFNQVVPIFSKERLEEEVAKTQVELTRAKANLAALETEVSTARHSASVMYSKLRRKHLLEYHTAVISKCSSPTDKFVEGWNIPHEFTKAWFAECIDTTLKTFESNSSGDLNKPDIDQVVSLTQDFMSESTAALDQLATREKKNIAFLKAETKKTMVESNYTKGQSWTTSLFGVNPDAHMKYWQEREAIRLDLRNLVSTGMLKLQKRFEEMQ